MFESCALDSDIVLKFGRYCSSDLLFMVTSFGDRAPLIVSAARFACRARARRWAVADPEIGVTIENILARVRLIEPSSDDIAVAADLEEARQRRGLALDAGESLLFAITAARPGLFSVTGDKRAIAALGAIGLPGLNSRIACFEQLLATLMAYGQGGALRAAVCADATVDRTAAICFQCQATGVDDATVVGALVSYIEALRGQAPNLLLPGSEWSAEVSEEHRER